MAASAVLGNSLSRLRDAVKAFYTNEALVEEDDLVLLAVSGGVDSMCMAHATIDIADEIGFRVGIAHINHKLRENSDADCEFVARFAKSMNIPFYGHEINVIEDAEVRAVSVELAAREARYKYLTRLREDLRAKIVAIGHNQNDQAETVLMRLIRGSGTHGLAAMRPITGNYVRPLLMFDREEITSYCRVVGVTWCDDETNSMLDADRNRVRHKIIPELQKLRSGVTGVLARSADVYYADALVLEWAGEIGLELMGWRDVRSGIEIDRTIFRGLPDYVAAQSLRAACRTLSMPVPHMAGLLNAVVFAGTNGPGNVVKLGTGGYLRKSKNKLLVSRSGKSEKSYPYDVELDLPGNFRTPRGINVGVRPIKYEEYDPALVSPVNLFISLPEGIESIRLMSVEQSTEFRPYGRARKMPISAFAGLMGVPDWSIGDVCLIVIDGQAACVPGLEIDAGFSVDQDSTMVACVTTDRALS